MRNLTRAALLTTVTMTMIGLAACSETELKGTSARLHPTIVKSFDQDDYPQASSIHTQGHRGDPGEASFEQGEWGALDVVVVVDNSGSMTEEQQNLSTKLEALMTYVDKADWQISVVTTDPADGCQRSLVKKADANATTKFQNAATAGTNGSGVERPFLQAVNALKCQGGTWVRPGSTVVVLMVTDEDNCSIDATQGYGCGGQPDLEPAFVSDYLASIRTIGKDAKVYGLYRKPADPTCTTALVDGTKVDALVTATGGKSGSICDADYSTTLKAISQDVAQILKYEFTLDDTPDDGTLKITVDGKDWTKFTLEGRLVKFTEAPPFGAKVQVSYRHGKAGDLDNAFPLEKAPVDGSFKVVVDGKEVPADGWQWNPTTKRIELKAPPAERAQIEIVYQVKIDLNDTYDIGKTADSKTLIALVTVGKEQPQVWKIASYDAATGLVKLSPAPPPKAPVEISFKEIEQ
jgi:hypothetical protein